MRIMRHVLTWLGLPYTPPARPLVYDRLPDLTEQWRAAHPPADPPGRAAATVSDDGPQSPR